MFEFPTSNRNKKWCLYSCLLVFQNGPITSWPASQRQVLVPSWQQLPGVANQRPVQPPLVAAETLTSQGMADTWRRGLMVDNFDQGSSIIPMVRNVIDILAIMSNYIYHYMHRYFMEKN